MSNVKSRAEEAKEAVQTLMTLRREEIDRRVEQLRRIKTPSEEATNTASTTAVQDAQSYIASITG